MTFTRAQLDAVARGFVGDIEQVPPMVSALKVGGRRLYELARAGEEVERVARPVHIGELVVEDLEPGAYPEATIRVACSSGTYIRTLAADLGAALGGPAHLGTLRRLRVGSFTLDEARPIESVEADPEAAVLAPAVAVRDLERVVVDGERARAVAHGATFAAPALVGDSEGAGPFAVVDEDHALLAVYERRAGGVKPSVVVVPEAAIS
jgi:tRNA pseudouridine55 synthase